MNKDFTDLEEELLRLQPRPAAGRIERSLALALDLPDGAASVRNWWRRLGFSHPFSALGWGFGLPVATALVMLLLRAPVPSAGVVEPRAFEPSRVVQATVVLPKMKPPESTVFSQTSEQGIIYAGGQPNKRLRIRSKDTVAWRNVDTQLEVSCPREDVVLVPLHVF